MRELPFWLSVAFQGCGLLCPSPLPGLTRGCAADNDSS